MNQLFLSYRDPIYRFLWSRVYDPDLAGDLTGEVFLRMVSKLESYQDNAVPFHYWLYRIARNLVIDHYRKNRNRREVSLDTGGVDVVARDSLEELTDRRLIFEQVRQALERLHPDQREVLELRFLSGLSLKETAQVTHKSPENVRVLQHRGLAALKANFRAW